MVDIGGEIYIVFFYGFNKNLNKLVRIAEPLVRHYWTDHLHPLFMDTNTRPSVLLIDDDLDYLEIIKRGLSNDFEIITIESFQKLKLKIPDISPSIILLDVNLGNTSPAEVIDYIKSQDSIHDIPIYLVSGSDSGRRAGLEKKVNGFMVKPATFSGVRDLLHAALTQVSGFTGE